MAFLISQIQIGILQRTVTYTHRERDKRREKNVISMEINDSLNVRIVSTNKLLCVLDF